MPCVGDVAVALTAGADAVSCPEMVAGGVEECITLAFEGCLARGLPDEEAGALEPAAEVLLFGLTLRVGEAGDGGYTVLHESGVGDEDHVGQIGPGGQETDVGDALQVMVEVVPLGKGGVPRGPMEIARHPGIDDVIDIVELGWAHQVGRPIEVGERA